MKLLNARSSFSLLVLFSFFSFLSNSKAQIVISGTISDPNNNLVNGALVEIYDQNDTLNTYSSTTDASGYFQISNITDIKNSVSVLPNDYLMIRNYPNPFNPTTIIYFELTASENIEIKIFDILGREVRTLFNGYHNAGVDQINWDGRNNYNQPVSAGVYLCQLITKDHFKVHKMVLLDGGSTSAVNLSLNNLSKENLPQLNKTNSRFNFTVKITGDSLDATYFRNLVCTGDTTLNLIVSKILRTETIGIDGGTVGNDDFKITIPAGAFDGNYDISLIKIEDDGTFGENTVTPSFKLSGIPSNFSKPIKIIGKYYTELENDYYLGLSDYAYRIDYEDSIIVYDLIEAYDSSSSLVASIPPKTSTNQLNKFSDSDYDLTLYAKFLNSYTSSNSAHFRIFYPLVLIDHIPKVAEIFENAYTVVFEVFQMQQFDQNYDVIVYSSDTPISEKLDQDALPTFFVSQERIIDQDYNDIQVGAVQRLLQSSTVLWNSTNWVSYAFHYWIEDLLSEDPNYKYPRDFLFNGFKPLKGLNTKYKDDGFIKESSFMRDHGIGMTSVMKYLRKIQNMEYGAIGNYFRNRTIDTKISAFLNLIETPINLWWPDYFEKYVNNELFELPNDYFITRAHAEWNINNNEDVIKTFTSADVGTFQDLSAKIFEVNLNYSDIDGTQNLKFKIAGPENNKDLSLILFSMANNKLQHIETTQLAEYKIIDPKSYFDSGTGQFLAVLVNSNITQADYLGESYVDLEVSVTPKIELPVCTFDITQYNQCSVGLGVNATIRTDYEDNTDSKYENRYFIHGSGIIDGSFIGNQFIGYKETAIGYDTLIVTLSQDLKFVESVSWTKYEENTDWGFFFVKGIEANMVPINCDSPNKFEIVGDDACNYIDEIYYSYWTNIWIETISEWTCSETSNIQILFSKKE